MFSTSRWGSRRSGCSRSMPAGRRRSEVAMTDLVHGGLVAAGLAVYLLFALVHPERF